MSEQAAITVKAKSGSGKGIVDENDVWYNQGKGVSFDSIQKGDKLSITFNAGKEGGRFVASFTKLPTNGVPELGPNPAAGSAPTATAAPTYKKQWSGKKSYNDADKMSKEDWAKKDLHMQKGGALKATAIVVASMVQMKTKEEAADLIDFIYDRMLKKVQE